MVEKVQPLPQSSMAGELEGTRPASKDSHSGHSLDAFLAPLRVPFGSLEASWVCRRCLMQAHLTSTPGERQVTGEVSLRVRLAWQISQLSRD